jgi:ligand-binding sensor domain-containing protein
MKKNIFFLSLLISFIFNLYSVSSQVRLDNWKSETSLNNVISTDVDSKGRIWSGCYGGIFVYNPQDESFKIIRNTEGLISLDISLIRFDKINKNIIAGTSDGILEIIDENFNITHITDIKSSRFPNPVINDIVIKDSLAYIAGGFGITVFHLKNQVFLESVFKMGDFQENTPVKDIQLTTTDIWIASDAGIAYCSLRSNITNPSNWKTYSESSGLKDVDIYNLTEKDGVIYFTSKSTVGKIENSKVTILKTGLAWEYFSDIINFKNSIYYTNSFTVYNIDGSPVNSKQFIEMNGFTYLESTNNMAIYGKNKGLGIYKDTTVKFVYPNSPSSNLFQSISCDIKGNVWTATDISPRGRGFAKFDGSKWKIFDLEKFPEMKSNHYFNITTISNDRCLISSWGSGFLIFENNNDNYKFSIYDTTNSPLLGIALARNYIVAGGSSEDPNGTLWVVNYGEESTGPHLVALDKTGKFYAFENKSASRKRFIRSLTIDRSGTKWVGSVNDGGLLYYNDNNTLSDLSDDKYGVFTTSNSSLYSETQNCLAIDHEGLVWVGTPNGLNCIINPSSVITKQSTIFRKITALGNKLINSIMVDALNYKWVGTNEGIWVLNPDATEVVANFNTKNSLVLSDEIMSLATNPNTGTMYIGTRKGLNIVSSNQIKPDENYQINCYPQPFVVNNDKEMVIEGLAINSDVRILTLDGNLIRKISAEGKVAIWDGKTDDGSIAPSGVYIISATSLTQDNKSYAKIAVINK